MRPSFPRPVTLAPVILTIAACADEQPPATPTLTDSAGVAIVTNPADRVRALPEWRLGDPVLTLGSDREDPAHQFSDVVGAAVLADGRLLVGDAESRELRVFDEDGRGVATFAGRGEGPGELPWLHTFTVHAGGEISVSAWPFGFISRFGADGEYLDAVRIGPFWPGRTSSILQDGSLLLDYYDGGHGNNVELWAVRGETPTFRAHGALVRAYPDGRSDTLRLVDGQEWFKRGTAGSDLWLSPTPFGPATLSAVAEPLVYVGETDRPALDVFRLDGTLERVIRWSSDPVPVTTRDREAHADGLRESLRQPQRAPQLERWIAEAPYPEQMPAFLEIAADRSGRAWVQLPAPSPDRDTWLVFDREGQAVARVTAPPGGRLLEIGDDYALVLLENELDVQRIERRPLIGG